MIPSEMFERARAATQRIRAIEYEKQELWDRIGVQGHSNARTAKNDIRDPMRHVDEFIDGTVDLDVERGECLKDVFDAHSLVAGITKWCPYLEADYMVTEYYLNAKPMSVLVRSTGYNADVCDRALKRILEWCDEQGVPRLRSAVEWLDE